MMNNTMLLASHTKKRIQYYYSQKTNLQKVLHWILPISIFILAGFQCNSASTKKSEKTEYAIIKRSPVLKNNKITNSFDPVRDVLRMKKNTPDHINKSLKGATNKDLLDGFKISYSQEVKEYENGKPIKMVVQITKILVDVPYESVLKKMKPEYWGINLEGYIGGDIQVIKKDKQMRSTHQIERMVLLAPLYDLDMTKSEVIQYGDEKTTIYWRVYHSDNDTTDSDIGYLEFAKHYSGGTTITFHSAHSLYLPNFMVKFSLASTFKGHLLNYKRIINKKQDQK